MHVLLLRAAQSIVELHDAAGRYTEADGGVRSSLPCDAAMVAAATGGQFAAAAVADEGQVAGQQHIQCGLVGPAAGALPEDRTIVDQAERGQCLQLRIRCTGYGARRVDVFDAQTPQAAVMAGEQPAAERGEQGSGVEQAGRRGRETPGGNRGGHAG
ncbi:hypothetical protein G6F50_013723 [Rhizopus delemar]|uniref:Uncharacterized protein n=1 Tax=Rhizopus delemar TaxID=936053 RepID=A0A9P6YDI8_9FUNG|nr:hypothetical protein G6F50_013723 [Rhizopus delemar]